MSRKYSPSETHKFFLYDPLGEGLIFFESSEDRDAAAKEIIPEGYIDPEFGTWDDDVVGIFAGEVTHLTQQTNLINRPADDQLDQFNFDKSGEHWPREWEYKCNYELKSIKGGENEGP